MKRLFVAPTARGRGVGGALIDAIVAAAVRIGYAEMLLDTLPEMHAAQASYRHGLYTHRPLLRLSAGRCRVLAAAARQGIGRQ